MLSVAPEGAVEVSLLGNGQDTPVGRTAARQFFLRPFLHTRRTLYEFSAILPLRLGILSVRRPVEWLHWHAVRCFRLDPLSYFSEGR